MDYNMYVYSVGVPDLFWFGFLAINEIRIPHYAVMSA